MRGSGEMNSAIYMLNFWLKHSEAAAFGIHTIILFNRFWFG